MRFTPNQVREKVEEAVAEERRRAAMLQERLKRSRLRAAVVVLFAFGLGGVTSLVLETYDPNGCEKAHRAVREVGASLQHTFRDK